MAIKEYFKKTQQTPFGVTGECNSAYGIWIDLENPVCHIMYKVYKDFNAKEAKAPEMDKFNVVVSEIGAQSIYQAMHDAVVAISLADTKLQGATLEQVEV